MSKTPERSDLHQPHPDSTRRLRAVAPTLPRRAAAAAIAILLSSLVASPAAGDLTIRWRRDMLRIDEGLREGKFEWAGNKARQMAVDMAHRIRGEGAEHWLGPVTFLRALAAAGEGETREAFWFYELSMELLPTMAETDLTPYGAAGELLAGPSDVEPDAMIEFNEDDFTEPVGRKQPDPVFAFQRQEDIETVQVLVQYQIGSDGLVRNPRIIDDKGEPTVVYLALEAVRVWEYEPATFKGEPVPMGIRMTFMYEKR